MAIATHFLQNGYRVALLDWDAPELATTAERLAAIGPVLALHADVGEPQAVHSAVQQIADQWGRLDALVNNAGVAIFKPIGDTTFAEWQAVMASNLNGPFICTQACVPLCWPAAAVRWSTSRPFRAFAPAPCAWPMAPARRR
jgi:NAD(P)-dependent dehydrogenase (short-subunit alcohol dehydrogenase family)